ncbi:hypothetical protein SAMN04488518_113134 [Pseudovibrio ascidiaceicola]|uniref:Uncharacterized protein n=1 Tax=Pseudovibrio ascidiaceicola TaxID=285279 RepID=A0A1I4E312_9HYPH|nr:hypothetical protein SAMN04488518_113134 [Pseudovibrio ascidiaceicola]
MMQDLVPTKSLSLLNNKISQVALSFFKFWKQSTNMIVIILISKRKHLTCRTLYCLKRVLCPYPSLDCPNAVKYLPNCCSALGVADFVSRFKDVQIDLFYIFIVLRSVCCVGCVTYNFGGNADVKKDRAQHHKSIDFIVYDLKVHLERLQFGASCLSRCKQQTNSYNECGYSIYCNSYPTAYQSFPRFPNLRWSIIKVASHDNNAERSNKSPRKASCCTQDQISISHYNTNSKITEKTPTSFSDHGLILSSHFCERSA